MASPVLPMAPLPRLRFTGRFASAAPVPFHEHAGGSELVLVTEGRCTVTVQDGPTLAGEAGDVFVLPGGVPHDQRNDGFCRTSYVCFHAAPIAFADRPRVVRLPAGDPALTWMDQLHALSANAQADDAVLPGLLHALLERLRALEDRAAGARRLPRAVAEAARWLEHNLVEEVRVGDLARQVELSPSHLTALFRAHLGCPPRQYQQRLRLALARKLLRNSYLRVGEVAAACGYADANYFIRVFRTAVGATPQAWRRRAGAA